MSTELYNGHIIAGVLPFWGHNKSICSLFAKLVRLQQVHITYFVGLPVYDRVLREISKQFKTEGEEHLRSLIRVVAIPASPLPFEPEIYINSFTNIFKTLYDGHAIPITPDAIDMIEPLNPPKLVLLDFFLYGLIEPVRSITKSKAKIYAWQSASAMGAMGLFGPEHLGGLGDLAAKLDAMTKEERESEGMRKLFFRQDGKLLKIPGIPPMYDYELSPQILAGLMDSGSFDFVKDVYRMLSESDGSVHATNAIFEGPCLEEWEKWLPHGPVIRVGPLLAPPETLVVHERRNKSPVEAEVDQFLDNALRKHGERSVLFMSFGTVFWPAEPEKTWAVIDVLIDLKIPFLFAHASPMAVVPDDISKKVKESGLGYMSNWLPQQTILRHKACGWFISHGGQNSTFESLTAGIPLIFWPFNADQPMNAANVAIVHKAGYELLEVRNGIALRPMHRLNDCAPEGTIGAVRREVIDVLTRARGEEGIVIRRNAQKLGEELLNYWAPNGAGWNELQRIIDVVN